jgi:hypothetical protein
MVNERKARDLCVTQPGFFFITKSSNKAIAAAILLDMHSSATPLSFVSFCFKLQFTEFQKDASDVFTPKGNTEHVNQTRTSIISVRKHIFRGRTLCKERISKQMYSRRDGCGIRRKDR